MNKFELIKSLEEKEHYKEADLVVKNIIAELDREKMEEYIFQTLWGMDLDKLEEVLSRMK